MQSYLEAQRYEDAYYIPAAQSLPLLSLGYHEALADLLWLKALIYFGDEIRHQGQARHVSDYADALLALDPHFKQVYRWAGMAAIYRTGTVGVADVQRAVHYLRRGVRTFPDDGELAWDLGATLRYELAPLLRDPNAKEKVVRESVEHLQAAARLGGGPPWLVLTNVTELRRLGKMEQAIRHLEEMYATVHDPDTRAQIEEQLSRLRNRAHAEAFTRVNAAFEATRRREFPYLSSDLALLVGRRPPVNLDERLLDPVGWARDDEELSR